MGIRALHYATGHCRRGMVLVFASGIPSQGNQGLQRSISSLGFQCGKQVSQVSDYLRICQTLYIHPPPFHPPRTNSPTPLPFPTAAAEWKGKTHIPYPTPKSTVRLKLLRISGEYTLVPTLSTEIHARGERERGRVRGGGWVVDCDQAQSAEW